MSRRSDRNALELLVVGLVLYRLAVRREVARRVGGALERVRGVLAPRGPEQSASGPPGSPGLP